MTLPPKRDSNSHGVMKVGWDHEVVNKELSSWTGGGVTLAASSKSRSMFPCALSLFRLTNWVEQALSHTKVDKFVPGTQHVNLRIVRQGGSPWTPRRTTGRCFHAPVMDSDESNLPRT